MKRIIALGVLLTLTGSVAGAESREDMSRDLVKVRRGQYVFEDYSLCKLDARKLLAASAAYNAPQEPKLDNVTFQVQTTATATADSWISRDYFAAIVGSTLAYQRIGLFLAIPNINVAKALSAISCKTLQTPIGTPDTIVKIFMTGDGMQIETTTTATGYVNRQTVEWEE
jgi:hypothetical protein